MGEYGGHPTGGWAIDAPKIGKQRHQLKQKTGMSVLYDQKQKSSQFVPRIIAKLIVVDSYLPKLEHINTNIRIFTIK